MFIIIKRLLSGMFCHHFRFHLSFPGDDFFSLYGRHLLDRTYQTLFSGCLFKAFELERTENCHSVSSQNSAYSQNQIFFIYVGGQCEECGECLR